MYVAVKGGEQAIGNAHAWLAEERRGDPAVAELGIAQIREQLAQAVNRVMAEGSLYDPDLAALAIKQARGDLIEAIFLLRAYRTTLPRFGASRPVDTADMACDRRISATFKDVPGGQVLGPTFDYTHRLLDFKLAAEGEVPPAPERDPATGPVPHVTGFLNREGLIEEEPGVDTIPPDLTREPLEMPAGRPLRLQSLSRADEGFVLSMAYSTQRGYARNHAFVGELRIGAVAVEMDVPELGFAIEIGEITLTECETVNQFTGSKSEPPQFTRGYGLVFGQTERKAISMALVDRALRWEELGEDFEGAPAQDAEFVLSHADNIQATGFLEHIKLPHYVDFQAELELVRKLRREAEEVRSSALMGGLASHDGQEAAE
ncbi:carbon-phosphorus lyase complex subunit PhnI [Pseudaestuariivita atlantica]|uniref:Carbon-phosphorus lyase complex subunit PhnI n=1 Tax=Pseudaestuariivita atlantica TaxID=1317121 RepID=A0A0L1JR11_9RHOB|nr:carbon-phosphorus lyase complex subunit PhnI [Pseudaestuariivita atlantica]KNG94229.1 carbon-phosphorus lyase complex subunit PhnI [Pseudaestuariivita atlantica]